MSGGAADLRRWFCRFSASRPSSGVRCLPLGILYDILSDRRITSVDDSLSDGRVSGDFLHLRTMAVSFGWELAGAGWPAQWCWLCHLPAADFLFTRSWRTATATRSIFGGSHLTLPSCNRDGYLQSAFPDGLHVDDVGWHEHLCGHCLQLDYAAPQRTRAFTSLAAGPCGSRSSATNSRVTDSPIASDRTWPHWWRLAVWRWWHSFWYSLSRHSPLPRSPLYSIPSGRLVVAG